jgi:CheY-like chemotaxis protein
MDILMPEMNGLECSNLLRSEPGPNRDTPIIAWSAHCSREDMLRFTAYGINDWLIKAIVIDGALQNNGMVSFAEQLTPEDAEAIRAYVVSLANAELQARAAPPPVPAAEVH